MGICCFVVGCVGFFLGERLVCVVGFVVVLFDVVAVLGVYFGGLRLSKISSVLRALLFLFV